MKVAIINDIHYGVRNDSIIFIDHLKKFLDTCFFPILDERNIKTVVIPGDLVDRRKYINYYTLRRMKEDFIKPLGERNTEVHISVGNHDVALTNTNDLNALQELLLVEHYNFNIYKDPAEIILGNTKALILPWINRENYEKTLGIIEKTDAPLCFGHLELEGFEMHLGTFCHKGLDAKLFSKFSSVFTGHFHHKSSRMNIHYTGAPYQMIWSDYDDLRGFHIYDTETLELEFIPNPNEMFIKIVYDDRGKQLEEVMNKDFDYYRNSYVKIIVQSKENPYWFDLFVEEVEKKAIDVKIQDLIILNESEVAEDIIQDGDVKTLLHNFVSKGKFNCDKDKLFGTLVELYVEAQTMES